MCKIKTTMMALITVFALSGIAVSSASAAWLVEGEELAANATLALASTSQVDESATLNTPSLGVKLTCTGGTSKIISAKKSFIQGPENAGAESFTFQGCSELTPSSCTIQSSIETEPVIATLEAGSFPAGKLRFGAKTGKTLATIDFKGTCAEAGEQPVNGQLTLNAPTLQEEQTAQPIEGQGTTENNSLELFKGKTYLEGGKTLLKLTTGKGFQFFLESSLLQMEVTQKAKIVTFTVKNISGKKTKVEKIFVLPEDGGEWDLKNNDYKGCEGEYPAKGTCPFEVEYVGTNDNKIVVDAKDENKGLAPSRFECTPATCK